MRTVICPVDDEKRLTPIKAIRAKCLDCCCGSSQEVELCACPDCPLYMFRFGKNPNVKLSEEERERRRQMARENLTFMNNRRSSTLVGERDG